MSQTTTLADLLTQAWQVRQTHFPARVEFVYPTRTLPLRSTEATCALNCAHCGGHYLKGMYSLGEALKPRSTGEESYLISGGCDVQGRVPHLDHLTAIKKLAQQGGVNLHTGLVDEDVARELGKLAQVVSFDFVVDQETIDQVYGLKATPQDFIDTYQRLRRYSHVVPHLCLGLKGGEIKGEYKALEALKEGGAEAISFIVFRPTPGTLMAQCLPPALDEVARVLATARIMFPKTPLYLGCMRPGGRYRGQLDSLALHAGVNKIVHPSPPARALTEELGLTVTRGEECCSL